MKKCTVCEIEKDESEFYTRSNKCKPCYRHAVRKNRIANIEHYRKYDRKRGNRQSIGYVSEYRNKNPNKYKAHTMVNNCIRDGKLFKEPCEICGSTEKIHAHHDDYLKPLNVRWLCSAHHSQWHAENGEAKNP